MLHIYHSNRLESLAERLAEVVDQPLAAALAAETVVTQNKGMARWLTLELARRHGIAANFDFTFPASFIWRTFQSQLPGIPERSGFERQALIWRVFDTLPGMLGGDEFTPLRHYLEGGKQELKLYQLARRIADTFDQYTIYRPDWIAAWESGEEQHWQAQLWRSLIAGQTPTHRARLLQLFQQRRDGEGLGSSGLPQRVSFFAVAALPPAYLAILADIAKVIDVHLFLLNPSVVYWGEIVAERDQARITEQLRRTGQSDAGHWLEGGNPLLASMGKPAREFQKLLQEHHPDKEETLYSAPGVDTALQVVQSDILLLQERGRDPNDLFTGKMELTGDDHSIQIHACHSPMRELEVLHDRLLALFDDPQQALKPQDVVVMTPDIDRYAPYIEAVFGSAPVERRIPWSIADRSPQLEQPVIQVALQLLGLPSSRFGASELLSILELPAVMRRFELDEAAVERIRSWVGESGIRWGLDAESRGALGMPATDHATWSAGLQRLLLGYAMADSREPCHGIYPYDDIEGLEAGHLGQLQQFIDILSDYRRKMAQSHPVSDWLELLNGLFESLFDTDEEERQALQLVRDTLDGLIEQSEAARFNGELGLEVIRDYLNGHLAELSGWQRFLTGQVTFCTMVPMRSIPFRVVALLGMNDRDFPRTMPRLGFDLMQQQPRLGDRSRREDDRYLFLEALLSARDCLYISYVGRSIRDNSELLPSVVVEELLELLQRSFHRKQGSVRQQLVTEHPLQPFSRRYFSGQQGLFSYASEWHAALQSEQRGAQVFFSEPLPEAEEGYRELELEGLHRFLSDPIRHLLQQRLKLHIPETEEALEDSEPFTLDGLTKYQLGNELLEHLLEGEAIDTIAERFHATAALPYGPFGEVSFNQQVAEVEPLSERILEHRPQGVEEFEFIHRSGDGLTLSGWLRDVGPDGLLLWRKGKMRGKDRLAHWLHHLALNTLELPEAQRFSRSISDDDEVLLQPLAAGEAGRQLDLLLSHYWQGLHRPLPLFVDSGWTYIKKLLEKDGDEEKALAAAAKQWTGDFGANSFAEGISLYNHLLYRGEWERIESEMAQLAHSLFDPYCAAMGGDES